MGDVVSAAENALAQPYRTDIAVLAERQDDAAFGIGEVDELRVRAQLLHVAREVEDHRQGPHRKEQSAGPTVLAERVTNAVLLRNFVVELPEPIAVDRRRIEDEAARAARRSIVCSMLSPAPDFLLSKRASSVMRAKRPGSVSTNARVLPLRFSAKQMSLNMLSPNDMLPAPMKTIFVVFDMCDFVPGPAVVGRAQCGSPRSTQSSPRKRPVD